MSKIANGNTYVKQIDGLRFFAVMLVALQHWVLNPMNMEGVFPSGMIGVTLFFVLSGFLITTILLSSKAKSEANGKSKGWYIKQFYIRRFLRIFPLYYMVVGFLFLFNAPYVRHSIWWLLTYTINFRFAIEAKFTPMIAHFWSLAIEEQFYLVYPFLLLFVNSKNLLRFFFAFILVGVGSRLLFYMIGMSDRSNTFISTTCFDAFGLGGLLSYLVMYKREWAEKFFCSYKFLLINCALLGSLALLRYKFGDTETLRVVWFRFFISSISVWFVAKAFFGFKGFAGKILENNFIVYTGKISYGWYVYHNIVPYLFAEIGYKQSLGMIIPYFIATYAISAISWKLVEHPINELKNKFQY